jgi:hypothetical protein
VALATKVRAAPVVLSHEEQATTFPSAEMAKMAAMAAEVAPWRAKRLSLVAVAAETGKILVAALRCMQAAAVLRTTTGMKTACFLGVAALVGPKRAVLRLALGLTVLCAFGASGRNRHGEAT